MPTCTRCSRTPNDLPRSCRRGRLRAIRQVHGPDLPDPNGRRTARAAAPAPDPGVLSAPHGAIVSSITAIVEGMLDDIERTGPEFDGMTQYGAKLVIGALVATMMGLNEEQQQVLSIIRRCCRLPRRESPVSRIRPNTKASPGAPPSWWNTPPPSGGPAVARISSTILSRRATAATS